MKRNSVDETLKFLSAKLHNIVFRSLIVVVPLRYGRNHNHKAKLIFQPVENPLETLDTELQNDNVSSLYFNDLSDSPPADLNVTGGWSERKLDKAGDPTELVDLPALAEAAGVAGGAGGRGLPPRHQAGIVHTDGHLVNTARHPSSASGTSS